MWTHWTARTCYPHEPFAEAEAARATWKTLTRLFPEALAAVLMPNHLHLILPDAPRTRAKLAGVLGAVSKRAKIPKLWQPIPPAATIPDRHHLKRQIRYVALNPCRAGLCRDPLEWRWSTYRDVLGAAHPPWVTTTRLLRALDERGRGFEVRFHAYVSGDPSVAVEGTPTPQQAEPRDFATEGIVEILAATASALRMPAEHVRRPGALRNLFIHLARRQGWTQPRTLTEICGITPRAVHHIAAQPPPPGLAHAALCLGDRRLLLKAENFRLPPKGVDGSFPKSRKVPEGSALRP